MTVAGGGTSAIALFGPGDIEVFGSLRQSPESSSEECADALTLGEGAVGLFTLSALSLIVISLLSSETFFSASHLCKSAFRASKEPTGPQC